MLKYRLVVTARIRKCNEYCKNLIKCFVLVIFRNSIIEFVHKTSMMILIVSFSNFINQISIFYYDFLNNNQWIDIYSRNRYKIVKNIEKIYLKVWYFHYTRCVVDFKCIISISKRMINSYNCLIRLKLSVLSCHSCQVKVFLWYLY